MSALPPIADIGVVLGQCIEDRVEVKLSTRQISKMDSTPRLPSPRAEERQTYVAHQGISQP